jgi:hypothetical protein
VLADRKNADRAAELIEELPERGGCQMLIALPRPDDFVAFARRGLFAYDWRDVHRTTEWTHRYELLARPEAPVSVGELPADVAALACRARFATVRFAENPSVAVAEHVECSPP